MRRDPGRAPPLSLVIARVDIVVAFDDLLDEHIDIGKAETISTLESRTVVVQRPIRNVFVGKADIVTTLPLLDSLVGSCFHRATEGVSANATAIPT